MACHNCNPPVDCPEPDPFTPAFTVPIASLPKANPPACSGCNAPIDCPQDNLFQYSLTDLPTLPFLEFCPEGVICNKGPAFLSLCCCGVTLSVEQLANASQADISALIGQLFSQCKALNPACLENVPSNPLDSVTVYVNGGTCPFPCSDGSVFVYVPANLVIGTSAAEALQCACTQAGQNQFCITTSPYICGCAGVALSQALTLAGMIDAGTTWTSVGSLPSGLSLSGSGGSALLSGTVATPGNYVFSIQAKNTAGSYTIKQFTFSCVEITTTSLGSLTIGVPYSLQLAASGGSGSYGWNITSGTLPDGLTLSESGLLSGTPLNNGAGPFTFQVTDTVCQSFVPIPPNPPYPPPGPPGPVTIASSGLKFLCVGAGYNNVLSLVLIGNGISAGTVWTIFGSLPPGLTLRGYAANANIYGAPTTGGTYNFSVTATTSAGFSATDSFQITVGALTNIASAPPLIAGVPYSFQLTSTGFSSPTFAVACSASAPNPARPQSQGAVPLPYGMTLSSSGLLSGTPAFVSGGTCVITVTDGVTGNVCSGGIKAVAACNAMPLYSDDAVTVFNAIGNKLPGQLISRQLIGTGLPSGLTQYSLVNCQWSQPAPATIQNGLLYLNLYVTSVNFGDAGHYYFQITWVDAGTGGTRSFLYGKSDCNPLSPIGAFTFLPAFSTPGLIPAKTTLNVTTT